MAGLPHYQNSLSSINKLEPVYLNQFEVTIVPPAAVPGGPILLQHVTKVSGLAVNKLPGLITQKYKFARRNYAGSKPDNTYIDVNLSFTVNLNDQNSMYVFKTLRQWSDFIYNPLTGAMGLKRDYTGTIIISMFNKSGDVYRRITCRDAFPTKPLTNMSLSYTSLDIYKINDMGFAVDYWDEQFL
jgi:hypothetical protein